MEVLLLVWFVLGFACGALAGLSVPATEARFAQVLGFILGPFGILAAILISIRHAIEAKRP